MLPFRDLTLGLQCLSCYSHGNVLGFEVGSLAAVSGAFQTD
jgi:hypothetical protein